MAIPLKMNYLYRIDADTSAKKRDTLNNIQNKVDTNKGMPANIEPIFSNILVYDFFSTFTAAKYDNGETPDQKSQFYFYYNVTLNNSFITKYFSIRTYIFNEYGKKYYVDSINNKSDDNCIIRNMLQIPIRKKLHAQISNTIQSQLWKTYNYRLDSNNHLDKYLYSDYFSPGYYLYTAGLSYIFHQNSTIDFGLVGGRTTLIKNQRIFTDRGYPMLYGLKQGQYKTADFGLSLQVNAPPSSLNKVIAWELNGNIFAPKKSLGSTRGWTLTCNNAFHFIFFKHMRITWRTQLNYDRTIQTKLFMANMISVGFYLNNHF